jgi:hypothetical protein
VKTTFIYCLRDPLTEEIRYVGKSDNPDRRLLQHIRESANNKYPKDRWINSLLTRGLRPILEILEEIPTSKWQTSEKKWIKNLKQAGTNLLNLAPGGVYIPKKKRRKRKRKT